MAHVPLKDHRRILSRANEVRELIDKNNFQPVIDYLYNNKQEAAKYFSCIKQHHKVAKDLIAVESKEEVRYWLMVNWDHGPACALDNIIIPLMDVPLQIKHKWPSVREFAAYRLQVGI